MCSNHFITNFPQNVPVTRFRESVNTWQRLGQKFAAYFFGPPCSLLEFSILQTERRRTADLVRRQATSSSPANPSYVAGNTRRDAPESLRCCLFGEF